MDGRASRIGFLIGKFNSCVLVDFANTLKLDRLVVSDALVEVTPNVPNRIATEGLCRQA